MTTDPDRPLTLAVVAEGLASLANLLEMILAEQARQGQVLQQVSQQSTRAAELLGQVEHLVPMAQRLANNPAAKWAASRRGGASNG